MIQTNVAYIELRRLDGWSQDGFRRDHIGVCIVAKIVYPQNAYIDVLSPSISEHDLIWKQGNYRYSYANKVPLE